MTARRPQPFTVTYDPDATQELVLEVKSKENRKAVFNSVDKLRKLGPRLAPPHAKVLQGHSELYELRPQQGRSPIRPLYQRFGDDYVILAVARKDNFGDKAVEALERAAQYKD